MKKLVVVFLMLGLCALVCKAEMPGVNQQDFIFKNLLYGKNAGFENGKTGWTSSGGAFTVGNGSKAFGQLGADWNPSASAQTLTSSTIVTPPGLYGKNGLIQCSIKTAATDTLIQAYNSTTAAILASGTVSVATYFTPMQLNFIWPTTGDNVVLRFYSQSDSADIYVDDCWIGNAANITTVNQGQLVASYYFPGTASCAWDRANANMPVGDFSSDSDCPAPTLEASGGIGTPLTTDYDLPKVTVNSLPAGTYKVCSSAYGYVSQTTDTISFAIYDETNHSGQSGTSIYNTNQNWNIYLCGMFTYTSPGNRTFSLRGGTNVGSGNTLTIYLGQTNSTNPQLRFTIEKLSTSSEQAINLNQSPLYGGVKIAQDSTHSFSTASGSFVKATDIDITAGDKTHYGQATITTTAGDYGLKMPYIPSGDLKVCVSGLHSADMTSTATDCKFGLSDDGGSNTQETASVYVFNALEVPKIHDYCAIFKYTSAQFNKEYTIYAKKRTGDGNCYVKNTANDSQFTITAELISQNYPMPVVLNTVTNSSDKFRVEAARVQIGSATIDSQFGNWITAGSHVGTGQATFNIVAGIFSSTPQCWCDSNSGSTAVLTYCHGYSESTSSFGVIQITGGVPADGGVKVYCMGPR